MLTLLACATPSRCARVFFLCVCVCGGFLLEYWLILSQWHLSDWSQDRFEWCDVCSVRHLKSVRHLVLLLFLCVRVSDKRGGGLTMYLYRLYRFVRY